MEQPDTEFEKAFGTEDVCPSGQGKHEPDWSTVSIDCDGDGTYVDVACMHCGRSGCLGNLQTMLENLQW